MAELVNTGKTFTANPFLIKRFLVTTSTTAGTVTHGGPGTPDMVWAQSIGASGTPANIIDINTIGATTFTVDALATTDVYVYAIWFNQVVQDGDSIS